MLRSDPNFLAASGDLGRQTTVPKRSARAHPLHCTSCGVTRKLYSRTLTSAKCLSLFSRSKEPQWSSIQWRRTLAENGAHRRAYKRAEERDCDLNVRSLSANFVSRLNSKPLGATGAENS